MPSDASPGRYPGPGRPPWPNGGMDQPGTAQKPSLSRRVAGEVEGLLVTFAYMAAVIVAFVVYRRLILDEYRIAYLQYGYGLVEAFVLAKAVMLGQALGLGRRMQGLPLIWPTLYKSVLFALLSALFLILEQVMVGLVHHHTVGWALSRVAHANRDEALARTLVMFVAFVPFFAIQELGQKLGQGEAHLFDLFFRRPA
jgi:hypothetical protein